MQTVFVPGSVSQSRSYNVFRFDELPEYVQDDIIEKQEPDYDWIGEITRDTIACDIEWHYPEAFFLPGVTVKRVTETYNCASGTCKRTKNDIDWTTDSYDNVSVTFAADVDTCQLPAYVFGNFPIVERNKEYIDIAFCHESRYGNDAVLVDFVGDIPEDEEISIRFETELERFRDWLEENIYNDIKGRIETAIQETVEYYQSSEYFRDSFENSETLYFIDGSEVPYEIASLAN
jgi:hypothetical protein